MSIEHCKRYEQTLDKATTFYTAKVEPSLQRKSPLLAKLFLDLVAEIYDTAYEDGQAHPDH